MCSSQVFRAAVVGVCLHAATASAGLFDDDEARQQINELHQKQNDFERRQIRSLLDLGNQLQQMRDEMARLRGQIEVLKNSANTSERRQQDYYVDLDGRLRKLEESAKGVVKPIAASPEETATYEQGLSQFKAGKLKTAAKTFAAFVENHQESALAPGAQLWLGYAWAAQKRCKRANRAYERLLKRWPQAKKAPEAMYALSECQPTKAKANTILQKLVDTYPDSQAAKKAKTRLAKQP